MTLLTSSRATARLPGPRHFGPFDLMLEAGERVAVLGPSGAGKSTLLALLAGTLPAHSGQARLDGQDIAHLSPRALARRRAVLPQSHAVAFAMPVRLVVGLGRMACEEDAAGAHIVEQALAAAHAAHLAARSCGSLSGGEQARVMLARVFAQLWDVRDGLLLVDEPLASLDPGLQIELTSTLVQFCAARGHALVAVLHDLNVALASFERLWLVQDGALVADCASSAAALPLLEALFDIGLDAVTAADGRVAVLAHARRPAPARRAA